MTTEEINALWTQTYPYTQERLKEDVYSIYFTNEKENTKEIKVRFDTAQYKTDFKSKCLTQEGKKLYVRDREHLSEISEQQVTGKTKSIRVPFRPHRGNNTHKYVSTEIIKPKYPIYIVSKGRYNNCVTSKRLTEIGVEHYVVCEAHEYNEYVVKTNATEILILPQEYLDSYDTCDSLGNSKSKGPGAARNFCIDHSKQYGYKRHWVMDDNLDGFYHLNNNKKLRVETGNFFRVVEDFIDQFDNVPVAGLNYFGFCKKTDAVPAFTPNTRIYSCLLIENDSGYRWRGRYNEDTDLSLRVLKDGLCTIQINTFLANKVTTQRMRGGNSAEFYDKEGTMPKSAMIAELHPDVAKVSWRFGRWHHYVDYTPYRKNNLNKVSTVYMDYKIVLAPV